MYHRLAATEAPLPSRELEMNALRRAIRDWLQRTDPNVSEMLRWQFDDQAKLFRPRTVFSCFRATSAEPCPDWLITTAQVVEMFHNVSLIIDDIVDGSAERRGKATLHARFGTLRAYMVSGYIIADGYDSLARQTVDEYLDMRGRTTAARGVVVPMLPQDGASKPGQPDQPRASKIDLTGLVPETTREAIEATGPVRYDIRLLSELLKRLGVAECVQWENRKESLGLADWHYLAREDTGSMFEICAALGGRSQRLRRFGRLLGMVYHGCDDVADVRGAKNLGGGGKEDLEDGILTLPAALAIRDDEAVRALFCAHDKNKPRPPEVARRLLEAYQKRLPEAEAELDRIAEMAREEARHAATAPEILIGLVDSVRRLST